MFHFWTADVFTILYLLFTWRLHTNTALLYAKTIWIFCFEIFQWHNIPFDSNSNIVICNVICSFFYVKPCVLKSVLNALFEFRSKGKYEKVMLNRLKKNCRRKIYINSFCLMSQVLFFFGPGRWTNGKRIKQIKAV